MHDLEQLVESPNGHEYTLGLAFLNKYNCLFNTEVREPLNTSDRCQVHFQLIRKPVLDSHILISRDFRSGDWSSIKAYVDSVDFI